MIKNQIKKFEKLRELAQKQLEWIQLELAAKQQEMNQLQSESKRIATQLQQVPNPDGLLVASLTSCRQMTNQHMIQTQQKLDSTREEIQRVESEIHEILMRYREKNAKVKSWNKLVERKTAEVQFQENKKQFDQADDRYLSTSGHRR